MVTLTAWLTRAREEMMAWDENEGGDEETGCRESVLMERM